MEKWKTTIGVIVFLGLIIGFAFALMYLQEGEKFFENFRVSFQSTLVLLVTIVGVIIISVYVQHILTRQ
jgi:hypothetical protein